MAKKSKVMSLKKGEPFECHSGGFLYRGSVEYQLYGPRSSDVVALCLVENEGLIFPADHPYTCQEDSTIVLFDAAYGIVRSMKNKFRGCFSLNEETLEAEDEKKESKTKNIHKSMILNYLGDQAVAL